MGIFNWIKDIGGIAAAPFTGGTSLIPALAGAGVGVLKNQLVDAPAEKRSRELAATTQRYSPWTGIKAGPIKEAPGILSSALQGGAIGASAANAAGALGGSAPAIGASSADVQAPTLGSSSFPAAPSPTLGGSGLGDVGQSGIGSNPYATMGKASGMVAGLGQKPAFGGQPSSWLAMR